MKTGFLQDCEHRHFPSGEEGGMAWCRLLTEKTGKSVGTSPILCARCRLYGEVDPVHIGQFLAKYWVGQVNQAVLGFAESQKEIETVLADGWEHLKGDARYRGHFEAQVLRMVELGRIGKDRLIELSRGPLKGLIDETPSDS